MNETILKSDLLFYISKEDLQGYAVEKIGRELNEEELHIAKKGLESGINTDIDTIYNTILFEMIEENES
ncbi:MAG: hypothetical protein V1749_10630 [Candidatus Desantisbacteria bacterium]